MLTRALLFLFSHRTLALVRWDLHFMRMRARNRATGSARGLRRFIDNMPSPRYLNLGSGPRGLTEPNWLNVDGFKDTNVHFLVDFSRPWPIPSQSIDGVFCEHVLEHFDLEGGRRLLHECVRVLKPGGTARFIMPDAEKIIKTYVADPQFLVERRKPDSGTAMEAVNSWFRQRYEHQCLYDWTLAQYAFRRAGFAQVANSTYRRSVLVPDALLIDHPKYEWESLYIEAAKAPVGG